MTYKIEMLMRAQSDVTELNWHGLVFDELINGQTVTYYSRHRKTASVVYVTCPTCPLVSSSKTKPCQLSSVRLRCSEHAFIIVQHHHYQSTHPGTQWNSVTEIIRCSTALCALQTDCHRQTIVQLRYANNLELSACFCH